MGREDLPLKVGEDKEAYTLEYFEKGKIHIPHVYIHKNDGLIQLGDLGAILTPEAIRSLRLGFNSSLDRLDLFIDYTSLRKYDSLRSVGRVERTSWRDFENKWLKKVNSLYKR